MNTIAFKTLGCRVNIAETQKWISNFQKLGFQIVNKKADFYIVNACAVTNKAEKETRQVVAQIKKESPHAKIVLTGCYNPKLESLISLAIPAINKERLIKIFKQKFQIQNFQSKTNLKSKIQTKKSINSKIYKTRAFIKVQDGCNKFCSYCIIPHFRGLSRSRKIEQIINEILEREKQGYKEIIICGINLGDFNDNNKKLPELIIEILKRTKIPRIRISSINPEYISDKLLNLFRNPRLMPHLHIPLQSGSDKILKLMKRNYTSKQYLKIIRKIIKKYPLFGLSTDIIIGFPNETDKDFKKTINLIKKIPYLKIHIFRFSPKPKTLAAILNFKHPVSEKIKKQRVDILEKISNEISKKYKTKFLGKKLPVLFEQKKNGFWQGYTPNYLLVKKKESKNLKNKIIKIKYQNLF